MEGCPHGAMSGRELGHCKSRGGPCILAGSLLNLTVCVVTANQEEELRQVHTEGLAQCVPNESREGERKTGPPSPGQSALRKSS